MPRRSLRRAGFSALLALCLSSTMPLSASPAEHPEVQAATRLFSAWLEGRIAYRGLPGVAVGVVSGDELVWAEGFGYADLESGRPMTPDTRFRMASHSKLFTATAIMQLREAGRIRLDDPVAEYLPWFEVEASREDDPPITVEHLLTHASGLPREASSHWTTYEFPDRTQLRELTVVKSAVYAPEVRWKYSNLAYSLLGLIVEELSGQSWAEYLQENIFDPLAMSASSVDIEDPLLARGYGARLPDGMRAQVPFIDARGMAAATGSD